MTMETQRQAPAGATDAAAEAATLLDEILADVVAAGVDAGAGDHHRGRGRRRRGVCALHPRGEVGRHGAHSVT